MNCAIQHATNTWLVNPTERLHGFGRDRDFPPANLPVTGLIPKLEQCGLSALGIRKGFWPVRIFQPFEIFIGATGVKKRLGGVRDSHLVSLLA